METTYTSASNPFLCTVAIQNTSSSTPFPQVAVAIRDAPIAEVIETFKALAELAIKAHRIKVPKTESSPGLGYVQTILPKTKQHSLAWKTQLSLRYRGTGQAPSQALSKLMVAPDDVLEFIYEHIDQVAHPPNMIVHIDRDITRA